MSMRLDKFLKVSRIIKRRSVAKEIADKGRIQINGKVAKSSSNVSVDDELMYDIISEDYKTDYRQPFSD